MCHLSQVLDFNFMFEGVVSRGGGRGGEREVLLLSGIYCHFDRRVSGGEVAVFFD